MKRLATDSYPRTIILVIPFISNRVTAWFAATLAVLLVTFGVSFNSLRKLDQNRELARDSRNFTSRVDEVLSKAKDAETEQRGYIISGNET